MHRQHDESVQNVEDKPWKHEELKKLYEACDLEKAPRLYKAKTGGGCDGFHPKVSWILHKKQEEKWWNS